MTPRETPFADNISYAFGPETIGVPQSEEYTKRYCVWSGSTEVRIVYMPTQIPVNDSLGDPLDLMESILPERLSLSFDREGNPVIAYVDFDTEQAYLRKYVGGIETNYTITDGIWPLAAYTGLFVLDDPNTDTVCLYMKSAGDKLYARFEIDEFDIEYEVNSMPSGYAIEKLYAIDNFVINSMGAHVIWGISTSGDDLEFLSRPYTPRLDGLHNIGISGGAIRYSLPDL